MTIEIRDKLLRNKLELIKLKMGLSSREQVINHLITQSLLPPNKFKRSKR